MRATSRDLVFQTALEIAVQHVDVVGDPRRELLKNELVSAILHLLFQLGQEGCFENQEEHALLQDFVLVAEA